MELVSGDPIWSAEVTCQTCKRVKFTKEDMQVRVASVAAVGSNLFYQIYIVCMVCESGIYVDPQVPSKMKENLVEAYRQKSRPE